MGMKNFRAPTLPNPSSPEYDITYLRQLISVLELYFNKLDSKTPMISESYTADNFYGSVTGTNTAYGEFFDLNDQTAANTTAGFTITFSNTAISSGVTLSNSSRLNMTYAGVHLVNYDLQFENNTTDTQTVNVWFKKNGSDVSNSNAKFNLPREQASGTNSFSVATYSTLMNVAASDYIELVWQTTDTGVTLSHSAAAAPAPVTPSARVNITLVSAV